MKSRTIFFQGLFILLSLYSIAQEKPVTPKGNLFIIGGGDRTPSIVKALLSTANLSTKDYIVVLPMSSEEPDTSYFYFKADIEPVCSNTIANLNFTPALVNNKTWLDSLEHAKLIFITGGDQERFMKVVLNTPVYDVIHKAYNNGATIAGTSAGAAVMSHYMITGKELTGDTTYHATFKKLHDKNIDITQGLGLFNNAIVDQHFIVRSRYNRLFSALAKFPKYPCIGIDESTAIIVHGNTIKIAGDSQVMVIKHPEQLTITSTGLIKVKDVQLSIYTAGDQFSIAQ
ncbi:MAG: cyanophycinase [Bacteroidota bacterium]